MVVVEEGIWVEVDFGGTEDSDVDEEETEADRGLVAGLDGDDVGARIDDEEVEGDDNEDEVTEGSAWGLTSLTGSGEVVVELVDSTQITTVALESLVGLVSKDEVEGVGSKELIESVGAEWITDRLHRSRNTKAHEANVVVTFPLRKKGFAKFIARIPFDLMEGLERDGILGKRAVRKRERETF